MIYMDVQEVARENGFSFSIEASDLTLENPRIFVSWPEQGAYIVSTVDDFHREMVKMVGQFGPPTNVEFRSD